MNDLDDIWRQRSLSLQLHAKFRFYSACSVMSVLLYGCQTWTLNKRMWWATVQAFHMWRQCRIISIKWNFIPNVTVAATSGLDSINNIHVVRARRFGEHELRYSATSPHSVMMFRCPTSSLSAALPDTGIPRPFPEALKLEPPCLITSFSTPACLWPIRFLRHKIVRNGGSRYGSKGYTYLTDWLTADEIIFRPTAYIAI